MIINMVGSGGGFSPSNAILGVIAYTGSIVTIFNGTVTKTVTADRSHSLENDNLYSIYYFGISPNLFSSSIPWDIQAEYNSEITYSNVVIDDNSFYNVRMNYILPYIYQQVTYLRGTGPQYIDALIPCGDIKKINTRFMMETPITLSHTYVPSVFGATDGTQYGNYISSAGFSFFNYMNNSNFLFGINSWNSIVWPNNSVGSLGRIAYGEIMDFSLNAIETNKFCLLQGRNSTTQYIDNNQWSQVISQKSLYLFAKNSAEGAFVVLDGENINRIYSFTMYNSQNEKIADLIPCYRKADSVIGMYDNVNNRFLTNQGTGIFTVGSDVTS